MTLEQQEIYDEGYHEGSDGYVLEESNPYKGMDAEYWSDGFADGREDTQTKSN